MTLSPTATGEPEATPSLEQSFADLGLIPPLLQAIRESGYTTPTPIQRQAIPIILQGLDVMAGSQTGTGKTASFALPLLQRLSPHSSTSHSPAKHPTRALVLCPTRELAQQVEESIRVYGSHLSLRSQCIYGGINIRPQIDALRQGREIIVATPGRLLDHVEQKSVQLNQVEMLVLDEADRMLDMGFIPDVQRILSLLPRQRQSLLFSATFSKEIQKLADTMLRSPRLIEVARRNALAETVTHQVYRVSNHDKRALLSHLLPPNSQALVFVNTKFGANRLSLYLRRQGHLAEAIHGDKSQNQRDAALNGFKNNTITVLVATDVAGRGLDIDDLPHVINFDLPRNAEDYVHRTGRTGRAGREGHAISLTTSEDRERIASIEKLIGRKFIFLKAEGFEATAAPENSEQSDAGEESERNRRGRNSNQASQRGRHDGAKQGARGGGKRKPRTAGGQRTRSSDAPRATGGRGGKPQRNADAPRAGESPRASNERPEKGRHDRKHRPSVASPSRFVPANGFDATKPYMPKDAPSTELPSSRHRGRRPNREVPALLIDEK